MTRIPKFLSSLKISAAKQLTCVAKAQTNDGQSNKRLRLNPNVPPGVAFTAEEVYDIAFQAVCDNTAFAERPAPVSITEQNGACWNCSDLGHLKRLCPLPLQLSPANPFPTNSQEQEPVNSSFGRGFGGAGGYGNRSLGASGGMGSRGGGMGSLGGGMGSRGGGIGSLGGGHGMHWVGGAGGAGRVWFGAGGAGSLGCGLGRGSPSVINKPFNSVVGPSGAYVAMYCMSSQAQAQAEGYAAGQQDAAYAFYSAQDPFAGTQDPFAGTQDSYAGANFYQDPCSSENGFAAFGAQGGEEESKYAMYAGGQAAQLGKHF
eukprot:2594970-Rhodomonas_salina.2